MVAGECRQKHRRRCCVALVVVCGLEGWNEDEMTDQEINRAVAESVGFNWWAVEKGGWYYRQGGAGYTNRIEEAGRYTEADARSELVRGEPMGVHPIPLPDYCNDLNAICAVIESMPMPQYETVWETLCDMIPCNTDAFKGGLVYNAKARLRAEAYLRTIGKWRDA